MKYAGSTLVILLFISLFYFIFPHSFSLLPKKVSADAPTPTATPTVISPTPSVVVIRISPLPTTIITTPTPTNAPAQMSTDAIDSSLLKQVNDYRVSQGLSSVAQNATVCAFANTRAVEVTSNFSHDGFTSRIQNKTLPYASYSEAVENIAMNSDAMQVVQQWESSAGHAENLRADTPYGCIGHSGNYYAYEGWKP